MKQFVFLYPVNRKFNWLIENASYPPPSWLQEDFGLVSKIKLASNEKEKDKLKAECLEENRKRFGEYYESWFNKKIDSYRKKGFGMNWFIYDNDKISDFVNVGLEDNIFEVGITWNSHSKKKIYPDLSFMLNLIEEGDIYLGGFNFSDCVNGFKEEAIRKGRRILIDEELTDLSSYRKYLFKDYFRD